MINRLVRRSNRGDTARSLRTRAGAAAGFTLLEVIVAVGAVALIGLGLARIFGATSETLRAGRRVTRVNDAARVIESNMREDFSHMAREGFLVIAHELTGNPVQRSVDDRNPRRRRIDQIMFFENGRFQTLRTPLYQGRTASGAQARVYYGHGLRQEPGTPSRAIPAVDDPNRDGVATPSGSESDAAPWFGRPGVNRFASDWILARHTTVLTKPRSSPPPRPATLLFPTSEQWPDNDIQVDLSPAASSIFRNMARGTPDNLPALNSIARPFDTNIGRPDFASGLIDIATTDLGEIRSIVLDAQGIDQANTAIIFDDQWASNVRTPAGRLDVIADADYDGDGFEDGVPVPYAFKPDRTVDGSQSCFAMKQWMLQALPAEPRVHTRAFVPPEPPNPSPSDSPNFGGRIRVEPQPPDLLGTQSNNGQVYLQDEDYRRTDQAMLASSAFAVGCTEFIVEWSFGTTFRSDLDPNSPGDTPDPFLTGVNDPRADQLIWHGLERFTETDFAVGLTNADRVAGPYYGKIDTNVPGFVPDDVPIDIHAVTIAHTNGGSERWEISPVVVHEPVDNRGFPENFDPDRGEPFYSIFGYVDPTFPGPISADEAVDYNPLNNQPRPDPRRFRPPTIPCAWPRLIRVTMTLADPADPSYEQTFQFIFEVPQDSATTPEG